MQNGSKEESSKKDEKPPRPRIPGQARPVGMDRSLPDGLLIRAKIDNVRYHLGKGIGKYCMEELSATLLLRIIIP